MRNPFVYGEEATDEAFCNRQSEIAELIRDIDNGVNVIIFSPRRYGMSIFTLLFPRRSFLSFMPPPSPRRWPAKWKRSSRH
jgi:hypothetical protein